MMEWNDKEKKIIGQLQRHTEEVDTTSLWQDIRPHLPVRRKRSLLPFFLVFLGGFGVGVAAFYLSDKGSPTTREIAASTWAEEKTDLLRQLKACTESKTPTIQSITASGQPPVQNQNHLVHTGNQKQTKPETFLNLPTQIHEAEKRNPIEKKDSSSSDDNLSAQVDSRVDALLQKTVPYFDNKLNILVQPVFIRSTKNNLVKWLQYVMAGAGPTFVTDRLAHENTTQNTFHRPMYHYSLEYGLHKRLFKNLMGNIGINYTGSASLMQYQTTKSQTFLLTDTLGYLINADGVTTAETGDVLATKITRKNGKSYQYNHSLFIHPSLEYDIPLRKFSSLAFRAGLMIPLIGWQKNSFLTPEGDVIKPTPEITFFGKPIVRSGLGYQTTVNQKTIGFYLDILLGSQKNQIDSYTNARAIFFPQTGTRIIF